MGKQRRQFTAEFKARVAFEALRGDRSISQLAVHYKVHPNQITQWRKQLQQDAPKLFARGAGSGSDEQQSLIDALYRQIGQMSVELDWLKKRV